MEDATTTHTQPSGVLTLADLAKCFEQAKASAEVLAQDMQVLMAHRGIELVEKAHKQGLITEVERDYLLGTTALDGALIVFPSTAKRLARVKEE